MTPGAGPLLIPGYNLNNLGRGPQDKDTYPNIKGLGLLVSDKKIFKVLPTGVYVKEFSLKKLISFSNLIGSMSSVLQTKPRDIGYLVPKKIFKGFLT